MTARFGVSTWSTYTYKGHNVFAFWPGAVAVRAPGDLRRFRRPILATGSLLEEMPTPAICQIHKAALGGAFELALACDFRTMPPCSRP